MPRRTVSITAALALSALLPATLIASQASERSTGQIEATVERSTAQIEAAYEPPMPEATTLEPPGDGQSKVQEGSISAAKPALYTFSLPADRMVEIRVSSPGDAAALTVFRGESSKPETGTAFSSRTIGWISSAQANQPLRVLVWTAQVEEKPFRLLVRVHPPRSE